MIRRLWAGLHRRSPESPRVRSLHDNWSVNTSAPSRCGQTRVSVGRTALSPLGIRTGRSGDRYIVALSGRLDQATSGALADTLDEALEEDGELIVLDISDLEVIDTTGVQTILLGYIRTSDERKQLLLVPGRGAVQRIIDDIHGPFRYTQQ
jgi:anti-anti-sigma factor